MEKFKIVRKYTRGNIVIKQDTQFNNIDAENVTIEKNVTARLYGNIQKRLILKKGAKIFLHGILYGDISDEGGEVHIFNGDYS